VTAKAKYGDTAVLATDIVLSGNITPPAEAWRLAVTEICQHSPSSQKNGSPKGAFLGLCEAGLIKAIPAGSYSKSVHNQAKGYALRAFSLLSSDPALAGDRKTLWQKVMDGKVKRHNGQMDVVLALWQHGLLQSS